MRILPSEVKSEVN